MKGAIKILLTDSESKQRWVTINENQICWIEPGPQDSAVLHMSNGDELTVLKPSYLAWENDAIIH